MKKIVIFITLLILLSGCKSRFLKEDDKDVLMKLGYSDNVSSLIINLSPDIKDKLLSSFNEGIEELLSEGVADEEILNYYLENDIPSSRLIYYYNDAFFKLENVSLYYKYEKDYSNLRDLIEYVNSKAYKKPFEEAVLSDTSKGNLMIASKIYYLDDYVPSNLIEVDEGYYLLSTPYLQEEAKNAFIEMADTARQEDLYFYISTAFRSFDFQNTLYNNYLKQDPQEVVDTYSSRPGYSDHQIGLSLDIRTENEAFDLFTNTPEAKWLKENAYKFGFIQRYPEGKEKVTGYTAESWHFRYVGKSVAEFINENNITFDEYYALFVE